MAKLELKNRMRRSAKEFALVIKTVPGWVTALLALAVLAMNLLANKSISLPVDWLALDCGILVSWLAFLCMDVVTKRFGPRAATLLSVFALGVTLFGCLLFFIGSLIPGAWGESFAGNGEAMNAALDKTFGGTWYVLLGSAAAFMASAVINNFFNFWVGRAFKKNPDGMAAFLLRSYCSTAVAQFADNLIFAFAVSHFFFGWTAVQCVVCALTGMVAELIFEAAFSFIGYRVCRRWQAEGVGDEYFKFLEEQKEGGA